MIKSAKKLNRLKRAKDETKDDVKNLLQADVKPLPLPGRIVRIRRVAPSCGKIPVQVSDNVFQCQRILR